jgi:beta-xylosidase
VRDTAALVPARPSQPLRLCALALLTVLMTVASSSATAEDFPPPAAPPLTWQNPVVPGDFPDPSATRVDGVYWATATASLHAPGFPLLRSTDLLHWQRIGVIFPHRPRWATDSLWAPELIVDEAGVRVYYTARRRGGRLCVAVATAPAPAGPYTDHGPLVCQPAGSIDATQVRDAAGRPYLVWKEDGNAVRRPSRIWIQRLRGDGLSLIGPRRAMLRNSSPWEGRVVEAPEIVAHGGLLYLFYSGSSYGPAPHCAYALGVARSTSVFGPWERDPANPILRSNAAWKCPGHASIVSDGVGHDFALYHAYRNGAGPPGPRYALLDRIDWGPDGWPTINGGQGPSTSASAG